MRIANEKAATHGLAPFLPPAEVADVQPLEFVVAAEALATSEDESDEVQGEADPFAAEVAPASAQVRWATVPPKDERAVRDVCCNGLRGGTEWRGWWCEGEAPANSLPAYAKPMVLQIERVWEGCWVQVKPLGSFTPLLSHTHARSELVDEATEAVLLTPCPLPFGGKAKLADGAPMRLMPDLVPTPAESANIRLATLKASEQFVDGKIARHAFADRDSVKSDTTGRINMITDQGEPFLQLGELIEPEVVWDKSYGDFGPDESPDSYYRIYTGHVHHDGTITGHWSEAKTGCKGLRLQHCAW
eukprot:TRINITY_DN2310_c0_g1_i1.p1 TRINITY_DN2310_c0_g1~~TRINITY_DN2310_c0_g1_i1.p1  ORF type:complete len:332 (-),score=72.20 TRINITY_DN2310_c0_g1_i1:31-936(-)